MEDKKIADDYICIKKIGRGAFADVFYGKQISTDLPVAIKMVNKANFKHEKLSKYLDNEIALLQSISHNNIIKLYTFFPYAESTICIILEYCNNGDLSQFIKKRNSIGWVMDESLAAHFLYQIIAGLSFCYNNNIIHRDIKPANLLLKSDSTNTINYKNFILKITDFGFAKIIKQDYAETICGFSFIYGSRSDEM